MKESKIRPGSIRAERNKRGWSQKELTKRVSAELGYVITDGTISNWEVGRHDPDPECLRALAKVFGVPVVSFLVGGDRPAAAEYVQSREDAERQRLRKLGFLPGFLEFLEGEYNCRIETLGAWIRPDTGEFGVMPDVDLEISFDNEYDIQQSAAGADLVDGFRDDTRFPKSNESIKLEDAAVFHFDRREDTARPLSELLELQNVLGRFARAYLDEKMKY